MADESLGLLHALLGGQGGNFFSPARPPLNPDVLGVAGAGTIGAYSSSRAPFKQFDEQFIGSGIGHNYNGYGFYLTSSKGYANALKNEYHQGGVVQQVKIAPGKMFDLDAKKPDPSIAAKIEQFTGQPLDRFSTARDALYTLESVPVAMYRALFKDQTISTSQQGASKFLGAAGYKGNTYSDSNGKHYVIYNPSDLEVQ